MGIVDLPFKDEQDEQVCALISEPFTIGALATPTQIGTISAAVGEIFFPVHWPLVNLEGILERFLWLRSPTGSLTYLRHLFI